MTSLLETDMNDQKDWWDELRADLRTAGSWGVREFNDLDDRSLCRKLVEAAELVAAKPNEEIEALREDVEALLDERGAAEEDAAYWRECYEVLVAVRWSSLDLRRN
jgi:hypothetical protein